MKQVRDILLAVLVASVGFLQGCIGTSSVEETSTVDSLNAEAYRLRYRHVQASCHVGDEAYRAAVNYPAGRAEACNHMAFCHFLMMDYGEAERLYAQVVNLTRNELERLVADVGLMQVYQLTAMNREYYLSRWRAMGRLQRIDDEPTAFSDARSRNRLAMARTTFWLTSARYHQGLKQDAQAEDCLYQIDAAELEADSSCWLAYHCLLGQMVLMEDTDPDSRRLRQIDELFATWRTARAMGYYYYERDALGAMGHLMTRPSVYALMTRNRPHLLALLVQALDTLPTSNATANGRTRSKQMTNRDASSALIADTLLPLRLLHQALHDARQAGDNYQVADILVSTAKYFNAHGCYQEALDSLKSALQVYNAHHLRQYLPLVPAGHGVQDGDSLQASSLLSSSSQHSPFQLSLEERVDAPAASNDTLTHDISDLLQPTGSRDSLCTELSWMARGEWTVPEAIARIREQLSLAYAGLEQKESSDYNRNAYLDILDLTRQDREWEGRMQTLEAESHRLGTLLCVLAACVVAWMVLFVGLGRWSRRREARSLAQHELLFDLCQCITRLNATDTPTTDEAVQRLNQAVAIPLDRLFGTSGMSIGPDGRLRLPQNLGREKRALARRLEPFIAWALANATESTRLNNEQQWLEKERYVHQRHIEQGKRENAVKKTSLSIVSGIRPYLDRLAREIHTLTSPQTAWPSATRRHQQYQYAWELVSVINEYNDILARWVQIRQGQVSLNIENFAISELFDLLRKGEKTFSMRGLRLEVEPTDVYVKADKSLTLFMLNTLADNARKFTPAGGCVSIYARQTTDGVVEVSVADTGCGLSSEQITRLMGRESEPRQGSGFGLMNCKGIIEKYRKTGPLFRVCQLGVESEQGRGSRFYFRSPAGVRRVLTTVGVMLALFAGLSGCGRRGETLQDDALNAVLLSDSVTVRSASEALLDSASLYANAAYYCNLDGQYAFALQYIDSALLCLNDHYARYADHADGPRMTLEGDGQAAELQWWNEPYNSDFHVILDVRNEAAVACLALKRWSAYTYNNNAYTGLYKLLGEDNTLEDYCRQLERSKNNRRVGIGLVVVVLIFLLLEFYRIFVQRRLSMLWRLQQVLDIVVSTMSATLFRPIGSEGPASSVSANRPSSTPSLPSSTASAPDLSCAQSPDAMTSGNPSITSDVPVPHASALNHEPGALLPPSAGPQVTDPVTSQAVLSRMVAAVSHSLSGAVSVVAIALCDEETGEWLYASSSQSDAGPERDAPAVEPSLLTLAKLCHERRGPFTQNHVQALPLYAHVQGDERCIGALCLSGTSDHSIADDLPQLGQLAPLLGQVLWQAVLVRAIRFRAIETARDEAGRVAREDSLIHVQNMVLDNCLSTIKHETVYYPSRIALLIDRLRLGHLTEDEERDTLQSIGELTSYYQGMHALLSRCADKQLEQSTFRRTALAVADLLDGASRYFTKVTRGHNDLDLQVSLRPLLSPQTQVLGDLTLLRFLLECLVDEALSCPLPGRLVLEAVDEGQAVRFSLTDTRRSRSQEELDELFYPHLSHFDDTTSHQVSAGAGWNGRDVPAGLPSGVVYLIGKQIIRDHDHYAGHRGCRMGAEPVQGGDGFTVYFTLYKDQRSHES